MPSFLLFLLGGLLAPSESQYLEIYEDASCTKLVSGRNSKFPLCENGMLITCVGSTLYVSLYDFRNSGECSGNVTSKLTWSQGVCADGYKGFCSGSTSAPSGAITFKAFSSGQCTGTIDTIWLSFYNCIPDGPVLGTSSMYILAPGGYLNNHYEISSDCSGVYYNANSDYLPQSGYSIASYYSAMGTSLSNMAFVMQYATPQCTGNPISGQGVAASFVGKCDGGTMTSCSNGVFSMTTYNNYNCTGDVEETQNLTNTSGCNSNLMKATCAGTLTIPGAFFASATYNADDCHTSLNAIWWQAIDTCFSYGDSSSYATYSTNITSYTNTINCTGPSTSYPIEGQEYSFSWSSSSTLTVEVSKFITLPFLFLVLICFN